MTTKPMRSRSCTGRSLRKESDVAQPWTVEDVIANLEAAAETARRLPPVRVQGHFNAWPTLIREPWEVMAADDPPEQHFPPSPEAVGQMLVVMRWMLWLDVGQRHLVWMRARGDAWQFICRRTGCSRTTAWRRWQKALMTVANGLNERNRNCA